MLFSALSKVIAGLLVATLTGLVMTTVFDHTVLNSRHIKAELAATNSYQGLSDAITAEITKKATDAEGQLMVEKLKPIITPTVLQQKIDSSLDQLDAYYRGKGPQPTLDLTDVIAQAKAAGVPIPEDSPVNKPIPLNGNKRVEQFSDTYNNARLGAIALTVALTIALLVVSWERHKWAALPDVLIVVGVLLSIVAVAFPVASSFLSRAVSDPGSDELGRVFVNLAEIIAKDLVHRFGVIAGLFAAVGVGTRIWVARMAKSKPVVPMTKAGLKQAIKL